MNFELPPTIFLYRLRESAIIPERATEGSACFDISAALSPELEITTYDVNNHKSKVLVNREAEFNLLPNQRALIPTGWIFKIPTGYSIRLHPRSGLALKNGIVLANAEAVIDEDYTQETFVMLKNESTELFTIENGMRIAQGELTPVIYNRFKETLVPVTATTRNGGFGSSGV